MENIQIDLDVLQCNCKMKQVVALLLVSQHPAIDDC